MNLILKNSIILSIGLLLGRFSGYIRELVIAEKFGISRIADITILSLTTPDLVNSFISTGILTAVLLPKINSQKNKTDMTPIISQVLSITVACFVIFSLIAPFIFPLEILPFIFIGMLSIFPNSYTSSFATYLTLNRKFTMQSLGTLIFNSILIVGLVIFSNPFLIASMILFSGITRSIIFSKILKKDGYLYSIKHSISFKNLLSAMKRNKPLLIAIFGNGIIFMNPIIDKLIAADFPEGSVAILSFAEKMYLLPVSIIMTTYPVAMYPHLVDAIVESNFKSTIQVLSKSIFITCILGTIIGIAYFLGSHFIVQIIFGITSLTMQNLESINMTTRGYIIAISLSGITLISTNLLFALKQEKLIAIFSIIAVFINYIGDIIVLKQTQSIFQIAWITSMTSIFYFLLTGTSGVWLLYKIRQKWQNTSEKYKINRSAIALKLETEK